MSGNFFLFSSPTHAKNGWGSHLDIISCWSLASETSVQEDKGQAAVPFIGHGSPGKFVDSDSVPGMSKFSIKLAWSVIAWNSYSREEADIKQLNKMDITQSPRESDIKQKLQKHLDRSRDNKG